MHRTNGSVSIFGTVSYVEPDPILLSDSIKNNITFGKEFNQDLYDKALNATQLAFDIKSMKFGDNTLVGDKGIKLSGGQRARISLARAVYAESDIYLFDDPLSAVDPKVGAKIMDDCILGMLKGKVRLLATHQVKAAKFADRVLILD